MIRFSAIFILAAAAALQPAAAAPLPAPARTVDVAFARGASGAHYEDRIVGFESVDYFVQASRGERMTVRFSSRNGASYFSLSSPGDGQALFDSTINGGNFDQILPASGVYRIRVALRRNEAPRDRASRYTLDLTLTGGSIAGPGDGPEYWTVDGIGAGGLLIFREAPSISSRGIGSAADGNTLRNLGCRTAEGLRWCRVASVRNPGITGWVDATYLREGRRP